MFNPNHVSVTVISARNLTGKGKNGKNDAFVVIQLEDKKFQTTVQKKSVAPCWEEECEFFFENKYAELVLTVHHRNLLGFDEFLGQIRLPLDEVAEPSKSLNPNQRPPNRWFPLKGKANKTDGEQKYRGELEIRLLFSRKIQQQQSMVADNNQQSGTLSRSKSPSISSFTLGRNDSSERRKNKDKTSTLPSSGIGGLKKRDFVGSMPSLFGNQKLSRPPSPTGSIASISSKKKKKSIFSKLKSSSSFHTQQPQQSSSSFVAVDIPDESHAGENHTSARNSIAYSDSASPNLGTTALDTRSGSGGAGGGQRRPNILSTLNERQSQSMDDEEGVEVGKDKRSAADEKQWHAPSDITPEPDDPQPVIKFQKRGGGIFTIGGGQRPRPASAFISTDHRSTSAASILPNRPAQQTAPTGTLPPSHQAHTAISSSLPKADNAVNANMPKEDLLTVVNEQRILIARQRGRIRELEEYIDQLLVRVIATQPELLQSSTPLDNPMVKKRANSNNAYTTKRASFSSFGFK